MTVDGSGLPEDGAVPAEPPPTPFERPRPRRRRWPVLLAVALVVGGGGAALLVAAGSGDDAGDDPGAAAAAGEAVLLDLLTGVDGAELAMLAFDDDARAAFDAAADEEAAFRGVGAAAERAVAALEGARADLAVPREDAAAEAVRSAYLPHLDAWIAYLAAVAADPATLAGAESDALILRINATAGTFSAALEEVLAAGVGPDVEKAGRLILERGFPAQEDADL